MNPFAVVAPPVEGGKPRSRLYWQVYFPTLMRTLQLWVYVFEPLTPDDIIDLCESYLVRWYGPEYHLVQRITRRARRLDPDRQQRLLAAAEALLSEEEVC